MRAATILIVEDNPANMALMEYLLRAFGYAVTAATSGEQAVQVAVADRPDLILMDLQLPTMTGFEARHQIRAFKEMAAVPMVAVTAFAMAGDRERVLAEGFDGYLSKPINPETFVAEVEAFLPEPQRLHRQAGRVS